MTLSHIDRELLTIERDDLVERLRAVESDPTLGVVERSFERRAIRARLAELRELLAGGSYDD